ncbi:proteasome assembly chaperone family protein [Candidatus Bathyarchaeota archaeon]|nr:proteasome assembly chaperone family protein [Candidatus Bathyarchaeota archaeon]
MLEEIQIIEDTPLSSVKYCLVGMPDTGLTGMIAVSHIVHALNLPEIGHVESDLLPPVMVIHQGNPKVPMRLFGDSKLAALTSETPINLAAVGPLSRGLVNWALSRKVMVLVSISGIAVQNRIEIETPQVFGISTTKRGREMLESSKIPVLEEGFMVGPHAMVLRESLTKGLTNIVLLAQSHSQYPDPGAAASAISAVNKLLGLDVDVKELLDEAEEIRVKTRELMQRTARSLQGMAKTQEQELPAMYG